MAAFWIVDYFAGQFGEVTREKHYFMSVASIGVVVTVWLVISALAGFLARHVLARANNVLHFLRSAH